MPSTLSISDLDISFGARPLVRGLDLTVSDRDVIALVGPNGSGKSTLLRTVLGEFVPTNGTIRLAPRDASIGWLPQVLPDAGLSLRTFARRMTGVAAADAELESSSAALASDSSLSDRYATALERWLALGAADFDERLPVVAARVGLDVDPDLPLGALSGGEAARACLVAILLSRHDVLLLDEPTNNLDASGLALMTEFVRSHRGPVLIAGHDRAFLDAVATNVVELDLRQQRVRHYTGGWSDFVEQRSIAREQEWAEYEAFADKRDALRSQARQRQQWSAQGYRQLARDPDPDKHVREKHRARADRQAARGARAAAAADRLAEIEQPRKEWQLRYTIAVEKPSADVVATLSDAVVDLGGFRLGPMSLSVNRGDRIAVTGANGSGKSTLLHALLGDLALTAGRQSVGARVALGVMDQHRALFATDRAVVEVARAELGEEWPESAVRTLLAKFSLGADHIGRPAESLSMGEQTRALMAIFQGRAVNTLVLDEPTNHLDVEAIEQLEAAVSAFTGTVLIVSHDARLLEQVGITHEWHVADGGVHVSARV